MNDEQMRPLLKAWFQARKAAPPDVPEGVARVVARVLETRQRGRWWPLPAFDRPVSTLPGREPAPAPIPVTNGRTRPRGSTMFSALKFITASVIVALFGGFLVAGVLTTPQGDEMAPAAVTASASPMTTEELLSGMVTEEVEPGVYRVVNDGVRDLMVADRIVVGDDGSVWATRDHEGPYGRGLFRLGDEIIDAPYQAWSVTNDGTLWAELLHTYDGERWTEHPAPPLSSLSISCTTSAGPSGQRGRTRSSRSSGPWLASTETSGVGLTHY